jgi:hypothetical protein
MISVFFSGCPDKLAVIAEVGQGEGLDSHKVYTYHPRYQQNNAPMASPPESYTIDVHLDQ